MNLANSPLLTDKALQALSAESVADDLEVAYSTDWRTPHHTNWRTAWGNERRERDREDDLERQMPEE